MQQIRISERHLAHIQQPRYAPLGADKARERERDRSSIYTARPHRFSQASRKLSRSYRGRSARRFRKAFEGHGTDARDVILGNVVSRISSRDRRFKLRICKSEPGVYLRRTVPSQFRVVRFIRKLADIILCHSSVCRVILLCLLRKRTIELHNSITRARRE